MTKFVSNRIEVLDLILEEDRKTGVKGALTVVPVFSQKRFLESIETLEVMLGFMLNLDGKPTTRHQMLSMISKI